MIVSFFNITYESVFQFVLHNSYPIIFLGMVFEGTIITVAGAFAASLGHLNVYYVFILAVLGDVVGDVIWYSIGYFFGKHIHPRISKTKVQRLKYLLDKHPAKVIWAVKLSPVITVPGLIVIGSSRKSFWKFLFISTLVTVVKTILFVLVGYLGGDIYEVLATYMIDGVYIFGILLFLLFIVQYVYKKGAGIVEDELEE